MTFIPKSKQGAVKGKSTQGKASTVKPVKKVAAVINETRKRLRAIEDQDGSRTIIERQFIYGYVKADTDVVFREIDAQGRLHMVHVIASHVIGEIAAYEVDGVLITPDQLLASGVVASGSLGGTFAGLIRFLHRRGFTTPSPITELINETSATSSFLGAGIAYVYARYTFNAAKFGNGDPVLKVIVKGKVCRDPRTPGADKFTLNPIVHLYDQLLAPRSQGGVGMRSDELALADWAAAANYAEGRNAVVGFSVTSFGSISSTNVIQFNVPIVPFQWGDIVRVSGAKPAALALNTDYHVIVHKPFVGDIAIPEIKLATSFANAMAGIAIATGAATQDFQVTKVAEVRLLASGSYRGRLDAGTIETWLQAASSGFTTNEGRISIVPPQFPATIHTVTADDIVDAVSQRTRSPRAERVTSLAGAYVAISNLFRPKDYRAVGGATFEAIDSGEFPKRFDLEIVPKDSTARRLAKVEFNRRRQEREITFPAKLNLWGIDAGDVIQFDFPELNFNSGTLFQVQAKQLFMDINNNVPTFGLDFEVRQTNADIYDIFDTDNESYQLVTTSIPTTVNPRAIAPPGLPQLTEQLFQTTAGGGLRIKVVVSWTPSAGPFLSVYRLRYRLASGTTFTFLPETPDTTVEIFDLQPADYVFRLSAINTLGVESVVIDTQPVRIRGRTAPPADPTGFRLQITGTQVLATWDSHPALDVRSGGSFEIWHHPDINGGQSAAAIRLALVNGDLVVKSVPFIRGTYYLRAVDQLGNKSGFASRNTAGLAPVQFGQIITAAGAFDPTDLVQDEATLQESPAWLSTNPANTADVDLALGIIKLPILDGFDDQASFDDVLDVDFLGEVASEAVYHWSAGIALDQPRRFLIETQVAGTPIDIHDNFDARVGLVDDFVELDTNIAPGTTDAWAESRETQGDPTDPLALWTDWERAYSKSVLARAVQLRTRIRSGAKLAPTDLLDAQADFDAIPNLNAVGLQASTAPNANFYVTTSRAFVRETFDAGQVRPQTEIPGVVTTLPGTITNIPVPRVGATTPKQAAFSTSVTRVGFSSPDTITAGLLARLAVELTIHTSSNNFKTGRIQGSSSPWSGTGSATVMATNFSRAIAEQAILQGAGIVFQRIHNMFWPLFPDAYATASPASDASNLADRMRAHAKALVKAFGPEKQAGKGDLISGAYIDVVNEFCGSDSSSQTTDLLNNGGPFRKSLGNDWMIDAIEIVRPHFPASSRLGWNEFGIEHGFSPIPEDDGTPGVFTAGNTGAYLFGWTNLPNELMARYRIARAYYEALARPAAHRPDFIGIQGDIDGRQGTGDANRAKYLDLPGLADWCCEMTNLGAELQITEMRLNFGAGSANTLDASDGVMIRDFVDVFANNSFCPVVSCFNEFPGGPYISLYDSSGTPRNNVGTNSVDFYDNAIAGISKIKPLAVRRQEGVPKVWSRTLIHALCVQRPILMATGTADDAHFDRRAGWLPRNATYVKYIDMAEVGKCVPGLAAGSFSGVMDIWIPLLSDGLNASDEVLLFFATGTGTDGLAFYRKASNGRLAFDVVVSGSSVIGGPTEVHTQALQAGGGGGDFPDGNNGAALLKAEALARSTRFAFSINRAAGIVIASFNGHTAATDTASQAIPSYNRGYIGSRAAHSANERYYGRIRRIKLYDGAKAAGDLETLSGAEWGTMD